MNQQAARGSFTAWRWAVWLACLLLAVAGCASPEDRSDAGVTAASATPLPAATAALPATPPPPTVPASPTASLAPTATRPTATPDPVITATPLPTPVLAGLDNTLVLYTALTAIEPAGDPDAYWEPYYGFKTWPSLPFVDPAVFDSLYGPRAASADITMLFFDRRAHASPDGRYLLVPGLPSFPEHGVEGTGTWLIDLAAGETRRLLPDSVVATWSPASDAITYVEGPMLYTLGVAPLADPQPRLEDANLWSLYAKWSPSGDTIATLIFLEPDESDPSNPRYFAELWLVPVDGGEPRLLTTLEVFAVEYSSDQVAWSPDGQYLLAMNNVYDLTGTLVYPASSSPIDWLPAGNHLLRRGSEGVDIVTLAGEVVAHVDDHYTATWAFSRDGRRLAYTRGVLPDGPFTVAVYDLDSGERWDVYDGSAALIRWSADDSRLILGTYPPASGQRPQIITVSAAPGGAEQQLLRDDAQLIEVVPYPWP